MANLFDTFNRINVDEEYKAVEEEQNQAFANYHTYYGYADSRGKQDKIESLAESTKNLRPKYGYGVSDGIRIDNDSSLRNGFVITNYGEPQQHINRLSGPAFIFRAQQGNEVGTKILQSEQSVARKQTHGLVAVNTIENTFTPQISCIKKIQAHEADKSHPRHSIRSTTYVDTRMLHRN